MTKRRRIRELGQVRSIDDLQGLCEEAYAPSNEDILDPDSADSIKCNLKRLFTYFRHRIGASGIYVPSNGADLAHPPYAQEQVYLVASRVPAQARVGLIPNLEEPIGITVFCVSRPFLILSNEDRGFLEGIVDSLKAGKLIVHPHGYAVVTYTINPENPRPLWARAIKGLSSSLRQQRYIDDKLSAYEREALRRGEDGRKVD